ncbi:uncharacterized protein [Malus domestica]|uniref:uncharacterized protein n=1 Tax=Malus domestica TaxID=3750 RepID=UPI003975169B
MANLVKLDFTALDFTGNNYLTWVLDTKIHLEAANLGDTIREESSSSSQDRAKAMIFIRRHLDEALKSEYLTVEDPITSQMKLCRDTITEEMLSEKTFSTFHASNMLLQQQYRARGFIEYNQLISVLLVTEQNNELLMKNHNFRSTGSALFQEVNAASLEMSTISFRGSNYKRGRGHKRGRWNGKGKNHGVQFHNQVPRHNPGPSFKNANRQKEKTHMNTPRNPEGVCHRCGGNRHWARTCNTSKHLVDLCQASFKEKGIEINFFDQAQPMETPDPVTNLSGQLNITHLDTTDFINERWNEVYGSH